MAFSTDLKCLVKRPMSQTLWIERSEIWVVIIILKSLLKIYCFWHFVLSTFSSNMSFDLVSLNHFWRVLLKMASDDAFQQELLAYKIKLFPLHIVSKDKLTNMDKILLPEILMLAITKWRILNEKRISRTRCTNITIWADSEKWRRHSNFDTK